MTTLEDQSRGRENSITFLRFIAACAVIYGHSYAIIPNFGHDWVTALTGYAHAGGIAVDFFFVLSGFLVTASIQKRGAVDYIIARLLRMLPALWVLMIIIVFIVGPIVSSRSIHDYFVDEQTWNYFFHLSFLYQTEWFLPGVFEDLNNHGVNGSIWSVILEMRMYIYLLVFYLLGVLKKRLIFNLFFFVLITLVWNGDVTLPGIAGQTDLHVALLFFIGSFLHINKDLIVLSPLVALVSFFLLAITHGSPHFSYAYTIAIVLIFLHLSFIKTFKWMDGLGDFSYGIYLWGWPVQQLVYRAFPNQTPILNTISSIIICIFIAMVSWYLIEKRALKLKEHISQIQNVNMLGGSGFLNKILRTQIKK